MTDINEIFQQHPFFSALSEAEIESITQCSTLVNYDPREFILRYQKPADGFWVLLSGQVVLLNHLPGSRLRPIETISAPNILGWSWLLPPFKWHFDAKAQSPVEAIKVDGLVMRDQISTNSELAAKLYPNFMSILMDRLQAARLQSMDIYG